MCDICGEEFQDRESWTCEEDRRWSNGGECEFNVCLFCMKNEKEAVERDTGCEKEGGYEGEEGGTEEVKSGVHHLVSFFQEMVDTREKESARRVSKSGVKEPGNHVFHITD